MKKESLTCATNLILNLSHHISAQVISLDKWMGTLPILIDCCLDENCNESFRDAIQETINTITLCVKTHSQVHRLLKYGIIRYWTYVIVNGGPWKQNSFTILQAIAHINRIDEEIYPMVMEKCRSYL